MGDLNFLSQTDLQNKDLIIEICQNYLESLTDAEDKDILKTLLADFSSDNWTLLLPQEINFLKSHDQNKWADYLIFRWKFKNYAKMKKFPKFPLYLLIEPSSICNLRCSICFQKDKSFSANKEFMGKMDFDLFTKIIDQAVAGGTKAITLASRGEPTLNPLFGKMLEYCTDKFYELNDYRLKPKGSWVNALKRC